MAHVSRGRAAGESLGQRAWRQLWRNQKALVGLAILVALILMAVFAPLLAPADPYQIDIPNRLAPPSAARILGTDQFGRDTLSRILVGSRICLVVAIGALVLSATVGIPIGAISAYVGGRTDQIIMRIADALLAFPSLVLALLLRASLGPTLLSVVIAIAVGRIPIFARTVRSSVLKEREKDYVGAARCIGQSDIRILFSHVLPNSTAPLVIMGTVFFASAVLVEAGMSYLGIGVPPPAVSWGGMLNDARSFLRTNPLLAVFPGLAISLVVLGVNLLGDGLRDVLDPRLMYD